MDGPLTSHTAVFTPPHVIIYFSPYSFWRPLPQLFTCKPHEGDGRLYGTAKMGNSSKLAVLQQNPSTIPECVTLNHLDTRPARWIPPQTKPTAHSYADQQIARMKQYHLLGFNTTRLPSFHHRPQASDAGHMFDKTQKSVA